MAPTLRVNAQVGDEVVYEGDHNLVQGLVADPPGFIRSSPDEVHSPRP